jgi:hypothetical protein
MWLEVWRRMHRRGPAKNRFFPYQSLDMTRQFCRSVLLTRKSECALLSVKVVALPFRPAAPSENPLPVFPF